MEVSQICSEIDNIVHKLNNINNSCKYQEEKRKQHINQITSQNNTTNTLNNLDTRDIPAAGYNGPQSNRSNAYWAGSLRSFWVRY
tara:strand:+ start:2612 stop:2866 length:255 start_codon:yes stop_codon:yes gene_type:complete